MTPLLVGAGISAAGNLLGSFINSGAQEKNAQAYARAAAEARRKYEDYYGQAFGEGSYNQQMQDMGLQASKNYMGMLNDKDAWNSFVTGENAYQAPEKFSFTAQDLYADPSYKFRLQQGQDALAQNQVAAGLNLSGAAAKEMNDYTQNVASQEYSNAYNRANSQYNADRNFDYTAWLNNAKQYYDNMTKQLQGYGNVSNQGMTANQGQVSALQGMADMYGQTAGQMAGAQAMYNNASASPWASAVSNIGNIIGMGVANMGTAGDTAPSVGGSSSGGGSVAYSSTPNYSYDSGAGSSMEGYTPYGSTYAPYGMSYNPYASRSW